MLDKTKLDKKKVWKIVRQIRLKFLSAHTDMECNPDNPSILSVKNIQANINSVAAELKQNTTYTPQNVPDETLETTAQMFMFLSFCPPKLLSIIKSVCKTGSSREIILALTIITKSSQNASKKGSIDFFQKVMESLNLNQFEQIQIVTKGKCYTNTTLDNCTKEIDVRNKETLYTLGFPQKKSNKTKSLKSCKRG